MRFSVQPWAPEYGSSSSAELDEQLKVEVDVEVKAAEWKPLLVNAEPAPEVLFVDGVRRIDANLWVEDPDAVPTLALAASYAAGAVLTNHRATVVAEEVRRGIFSSATNAESISTRHATYEVHLTSGVTSEELWLGPQNQMAVLEGQMAVQFADVPLLVVDGPLSHHRTLSEAVGYIKTQHVHYLPPNLRSVLTQLRPGDRTPLFLVASGSRQWHRFSWYLRLPMTGAGPMDGIVRAEVSADRDVATARRQADLMAATVCRYASEGHKDPRAPQNLYPVGGLERRLRRLLGDPELLYRSLRQAAAMVTVP
ncbi:MAG: hypothetical protein ACRDWA_12125 [Acidimicrobiia bacterium]